MTGMAVGHANFLMVTSTLASGRITVCMVKVPQVDDCIVMIRYVSYCISGVMLDADGSIFDGHWVHNLR